MNPELVRLGLPKGRMQEGVVRLLRDAGIDVRVGERQYRPSLSIPGYEAKIQKPQNIIEMLDAGTRDLGFAGADWVAELDADVVEVLDTGLDRVRMVAAARGDLLVDGALPQRRLVVASEYERLATDWISHSRLDARFVRSYGATEVFPPEDADVVIDITATGSTLAANGLVIVEEISESSTRLYASHAAVADPAKLAEIDEFALLLGSVLEARQRVMLELNVDKARLDAVVAVLPCMREPTIATLHHDAGYAVKVVVPRIALAKLIPLIKSLGGTDLVVSDILQVVS